MIKIVFIAPLFFFTIGCQKSISVNVANGTGDSTLSDSTFSHGDIITYEVITKDTSGWFGIWADSTGNVAGTPYDSVNYGSPIYNYSGWKYSFEWNGYSAQLMMSVAARTYNEDITINIYRNNELIQSATNDQMKGVAKTLYNIKGDSLQGTAEQPVLTYEVLLDNMDSSLYQYDGWNGNWRLGNNEINILTNPLTDQQFIAIPSGWRYNFKPDKLPFTMSMQTFPYSEGGSTVTANFYVNGRLVKTNSSGSLTYPPITYEVL
jgi:hypothetical protein